MSRAGRSDGDLTKSKILDAAGRLIAQDGFAKTTSKAIAKLAEVDLAAINYHFDGRDGLYRAVLAEAHTHYIDEQELLTLLNSSKTPTEKLEAFFVLFSRILLKNIRIKLGVCKIEKNYLKKEVDTLSLIYCMIRVQLLD